MKKASLSTYTCTLILGVSGAMLMSCAPEHSQPPVRASQAKISAPIEVSNLVDQASQDQLSTALLAAGIEKERVQDFMSEVQRVNVDVPHNSLVDHGFVPLTDAYHLPAISSTNTTLTNCRINTFLLSKDLINARSSSEVDSSLLFFDKESIDAFQPPLFTSDEMAVYNTLFGRIPTTSAKDSHQHVADIGSYFDQHQISFTNPHVHIVSVFLHDVLTEPAALFIGHVGVAVAVDNGYLFVEKVAFESPYQLLKVRSLKDLYAHLFRVYNTSDGQDYGAPVILDNAEVKLSL
ncbi:DUF4300 family protein [Corynebacterium sp. ES2794-CONJ1]|uniref:DUF4300 family protein n=1 Tax=Corynebacterium sp. ES2794-CONJ1 TaxID=2980553 RepID=UPI0021DB2725|nr:DUF4300 family protein [Corynebacterium sp. ES2794-CONJ1]MCU9520013.1 DUF4300 family protein [Corynebacterium sp. ES2794-CONJ1]